uniref:Uncharacterized protein n=1 Tax=Anguilla anguilla TaxID=7936 RepID=A0A0E9UK72_ANGAN
MLFYLGVYQEALCRRVSFRIDEEQTANFK